MAKDPREEQRPDAERIPDDRPGRLDTDVDRVEGVDDDDLDLDDEDLDDDDEEDEDLEEV